MGIGWFRRQRRPTEAATSTVVRRAPSGDAGHALRAPSPLHAFNRYEIKYLVERSQVDGLRRELAQRMDLDPHGTSGGYGVWSVYYDTDQLRFYWEKIEGLRFRRKLRIRHYGDRFTIDKGTPVFVEIKQRVNRVTQKRRVQLPYQDALRLCGQRELIEPAGADPAFLAEVLELVVGLDLRPTGITGYQREAFLGAGADVGLRVTIDSRVRGRDRDFDLAADGEHRYFIPPRLCVLEVKANDRVPYWLTDLTARHSLSVARISKYCQGVEAFGRAPRSVFHVSDEEPDIRAALPAATVSEDQLDALQHPGSVRDVQRQ